MNWFLIMISTTGIILVSSPFPSKDFCQQKMQEAKSADSDSKMTLLGCYSAKEYGADMQQVFLPDGFKKPQ